MKRRLLYLPLAIVIFLGHSVLGQMSAFETDWTEKKLGRVIIKAHKATQQKKWPLAIKYGERALEGSHALDQHKQARYINQLKNLNTYYNNAGRLNEVAERVKLAFYLSRENLGAIHETTMISRTLYYKLLIANKDYKNAIPLVMENIKISKKNNKADYKQLYYLKQLFSLYGLTGQLEKQEKFLLQYLKLNQYLYGEDDEDNAKTRNILAKNYCRQNKVGKFEKLITAHKLKYFCNYTRNP